MPTQSNPAVRLLPYPGGRTFAFTIIDDTDNSTLESTYPIYEFLYSIGLRTTKTVWPLKPEAGLPQAKAGGDTLERPEYLEYVRSLRDRGFEIALHNVSGASNRRERTVAGMEQFRRLLGFYPRINVHHEKNRENLYFGAAQDSGRLPCPFHSAAFRGMYQALRRVRRRRVPAAGGNGCSGEDPESEYFWGDICKAQIRYVRTNVFLDDLNTLKVCPSMPMAFPDTPYVNYWFYSSNGQNARQFNAMLSEERVTRLRREQGCSILYTHFGFGFTVDRGGRLELNGEVRQRLGAVAGSSEGWFVTTGELLDRLLLFQSVKVRTFPGGVVITNGNTCQVDSLTLLAAPGARYRCPDGAWMHADSRGVLVVPELAAEGAAVLLEQDFPHSGRCWHQDSGPLWRADLHKAARRIGRRMGLVSA